jgi:3-isopropylmalate/(R)-2-methylmalate dehydratase small subunit
MMSGRAWRFGDHVTTDDILPGRYLDRAGDELGQYAMSGIDPGFAARVRPGDFIVAGESFGTGSGRDSAATALKLAGIAAIIAPSYGRIFYRNAINLGLPAVIVASTADIAEGDALLLDLDRRRLIPRGGAASQPVLNMTGIAREILDAGGIVPFTKRRLGRA